MFAETAKARMHRNAGLRRIIVRVMSGGPRFYFYIHDSGGKYPPAWAEFEASLNDVQRSRLDRLRKKYPVSELTGGLYIANS